MARTHGFKTAEFDLEDRNEVFQEVVAAFEEKYSWWGKQLARNMLTSIATWHIDVKGRYDSDRRVRRHLLVYASRGWLKSTIVKRFCKLLDADLGKGRVGEIGDITKAAYRGSFTNGNFTPPDALKHDILLIDEYGTIANDEDLIQLVNQGMEGGRINAEKQELSDLDDDQREELEGEFADKEFEWLKDTKFTYRTKALHWANTYKKEHIVDGANASRFYPIFPRRRLTSELTKHVDSAEFQLDEAVSKRLREIVDDRGVPEDASDNVAAVLKGEIGRVNIPERYYDKFPNLSPRESNAVTQHVAGLMWWGEFADFDDVDLVVQNIRKLDELVEEGSNETAEDVILKHITDNPMTVDEIVAETEYSESHVYNTLRKLEGDTPLFERQYTDKRGELTAVKWSTEGAKTKYEEGF